ncbi:SUKH superfamily protein [Cricetibacter osteomyelitidis]|uniref:SUKH superfamily protein n=1 Tax=Cricetibacter osteomyelitidis TaxID=1521931 RepID=A0A4R2SRU8_9PAST|nr:SMI1/KNR4 family protein [Cricetibacter osteomyelitidis]TCP92050.1 SUKH superfamily protein [Cricetibacter osteomyelitidis]
MLNKLVSSLPFKLPTDYLDFLQKINGGEGFIDDEYIILWKAEELILFNNKYEVAEYTDDIFLIGSNGGGEAIAYDLKTMNIVFIPFIGMSRKYLIFKSKNFLEFINGN